MTIEFKISTENRYQLVDITEKIEKLVRESNILEGICSVFVPHSTVGIILMENDESLKEDWLIFLKKLVSGSDFAHNKIDSNADSHLLSGLIGQEKNLIVKEGKLVRGIWQQIFLAEFDGPKERKVIVKLTEG